MSEWISVESKLPSINEEVIVYTNEYDPLEEKTDSSIYVAWIDGFGENNKPCWSYSWCCGCRVNEKITHWQHLPEAPK